MAEEETATWCLGVAESGRRELSDEEHRVLHARLAQPRTALKMWRFGWILFWISAVLLYPFCYEALAVGLTKKPRVPFLYFVFSSGPAAALMAAAGGSFVWVAHWQVCCHSWRPTCTTAMRPGSRPTRRRCAQAELEVRPIL